MNDSNRSAFEQAESRAPRSVLGEIFEFLKHNKKFYLVPIVLVLVMFGVLIALGGTAAAPFIYTLF